MARSEEHGQPHARRLIERCQGFHQLRPCEALGIRQADAFIVTVGLDLQKRHATGKAIVLFDPALTCWVVFGPAEA